MGKPEGIVENRLKQQAKKHGMLCYKFVSPANRGVPDDILITGDGQVVFVECKAEKGKLSELQELTHKKFAAHNVIVEVVWSKQDVDELIKRLVQKE